MKTPLGFVLVLLAACDGGSGSGDPTPDASATPDAPRPDAAVTPDASLGNAVTIVDCAQITPAGDLWYYSGIGYLVPAPITVGQVIRIHDLESHTADHVSGLWSASGNAEQCIRFDEAGAYPFGCYFHPDETGTITVQ
ncbi:MAG: hypothetical protein SFX73_30390 [Kofleriaceae bacterium]|nr:hypothetical protein [Kofleriaceae bacterium]